MRIFVGCASRVTYNPEYNELAENIGDYIAKGNHTYVFGGCDNGLMGEVYSVVKKHGCKVIACGVDCYKDEIVKLYKDNDNVDVTIASTVNERKDNVIQNADVIVFLPGGIGSLDEIFACIESRRAGEHDKPIFIVNVNGYYDALFKMLETMYSEGFASESNREVYMICNSFEELKNELNKIEYK